MRIVLSGWRITKMRGPRTMSPSRMESAAVAYAQRLGWPVFPCHSVDDGRCDCGNPDCGSPGKHPMTTNGFKDATRDESKIRDWWWNYPTANIGVPTGAVSGFDVLDVDPRHGGEQSLEDVESESGALPDTVEQQTGGGGRHILFRHSVGMSSKVGVRPGLDYRADGGYIIAAPSIHRQRRRIRLGGFEPTGRG